MGSCASVPKGTPTSAMKLGLSFGSKKDKLVTPESPTKNNQVINNHTPVKTFDSYGMLCVLLLLFSVFQLRKQWTLILTCLYWLFNLVPWCKVVFFLFLYCFCTCVGSEMGDGLCQSCSRCINNMTLCFENSVKFWLFWKKNHFLWHQ